MTHVPWKGHDWAALDRLHAKDMILDPANKAKSVVLTDEGLARSEQPFREMFGKSVAPQRLTQREPPA